MKKVVIHKQTKYPESAAYHDDYYEAPTEDYALDWLLDLSAGPSYSSTQDFFNDPEPEKSEYGLVWRETEIDDQKYCWYMKRGVGILWKARIQPLIPAPIINTDPEFGGKK